MTTSRRPRCALVTGVTSGIGLAITRALLQEGVFVIGVARDASKLQSFAGEFGRNFRGVIANLAEEEAVETIKGCLKHFSEIDILISNAAECVFQTPLELPPTDLERLFRVNVLAPIELVRTVLPKMRTGAQVIQISSVTADFVPNSQFAPYATTKQAINQLMAALRWELHPKGISVSLVSPGLVDTAIYDQVPQFAKTRQKLEQHVPEWLSPNDVAETVIWVLNRPKHTVVSELVVLPARQGR